MYRQSRQQQREVYQSPACIYKADSIVHAPDAPAVARVVPAISERSIKRWHFVVYTKKCRNVPEELAARHGLAGGEAARDALLVVGAKHLALIHTEKHSSF